eukprot:7765936-Alexandrium_andersonii.AAC.1
MGWNSWKGTWNNSDGGWNQRGGESHHSNWGYDNDKGSWGKGGGNGWGKGNGSAWSKDGPSDTGKVSGKGQGA